MGATIDNAPHSTPKAAAGADTISFSMANILSGNVASTPSTSESASAPGNPSVSWDNVGRCWVRTGALEVHRGLGNNGRSDYFHPYLPASSSQHSNTLRQFIDRGWITTISDQFARERNQTGRNQLELVNLGTRARKIQREDSGYHSEQSNDDSNSQFKRSTPSSDMPVSSHHSIYDDYPISIGQYSPTIPQSGSPDSFSISCGNYSPSDQGNFSSTNRNGKQVNVVYPLQVVSPDMQSNGYISGSDGSLSPTERNYPVGDLDHARSSAGRAAEEASAPSDIADSQFDEPRHDDVEGLHTERTDEKNSTVEHHADNQDVEGSPQRNARRSNESPEKGAPKKKRRVLFTKEQTSELERLFVANHYVVPQDRDAIAKKLNMHPDQVKIWFQNHRYKLKKFVDDMKAKGIPYYISLRVPKESLRAESFLSSFPSAHSRLSPDSLAYPRLGGPAAASAYNLVPSPYSYPSQPTAPMGGTVPYYPDPYHCGTLPLHPYEGRMLTHYGNSPLPTASLRVPHPYPYPNMLHVPVLASPYQALHKPLIRL